MKPSKKSQAKATIYAQWKRKTAIPYLKEKFGTWCRRCGKDGYHHPLDIDHIIQRSKRPDLVFDLDNLQLLCRQCHNDKTLIEGRPDFDNDKFLADENGKIESCDSRTNNAIIKYYGKQ